MRLSRIPAGHPEGYIEAFATLYREFSQDVRRLDQQLPAMRNYPGLEDGLRGLRFVEATIESSQRGSAWVKL